MKTKNTLTILLVFIIFLLPHQSYCQTKDQEFELFKQGEDAYNNGRLEEALNYFQSALEICKRLNSRNILANLDRIAAIYYDSGQYEKALIYQEELLKTSRKFNFPVDIIRALITISVTSEVLGQHDKALLYCEEALKIAQDNGLNEWIPTINHNMTLFKQRLSSLKEIEQLHRQGLEAMDNSRYEDALRYFTEEFLINKKIKAIKNVLGNLIDIGSIYRLTGNYEKALSHFKEMLDQIREKTDFTQEKQVILNQIGMISHSLGKYEEALSYYLEALQLGRDLKNPPTDRAAIIHNIGLTYYSLGRYDEALSYYKLALETARISKNLAAFAIASDNIARAYRSLGQYDKALSHCQEALELLQGEVPIPHLKNLTLENMAYIYLSQKKYKEAEEKFLGVEREYKKLGVEYQGLSDLYIATRRYDKALALLETSEPPYSTGIMYQIRFHAQKGLALKGAGLLKEASNELLKTISLSEEIRDKIKTGKESFFGSGFYGGHIRAYRALVSSLSERYLKGEKKDSLFSDYGKDLVSSAFYFSEATKARILLEAMAESAKKYETQELPPELYKKEQDILNQLLDIENNWEVTYKKGKEEFKALIQKKQSLRKELDSFISQIRKDYPKYTSLNYPKPIAAEEIPLKDNEVLLEYALCDDAGYIFKVRKGGVREIIKIPKSKEEIENLVTQFCLPFELDIEMQIILYENFSASQGKVLYDLLLAKALSNLSSDTVIIIVADGILGRLPFEALVINPAKRLERTVFVADKWNISYYQSAAVLALNRMLRTSKATKLLFALGNPIFSKDDPRYVAYKTGSPQPILLTKDIDMSAHRALATRIEWGKTTKDDTDNREILYQPLPETEKELRSIAQLFNTQAEPPDILLGIFANETNLRHISLNNYRYLHFATHADLPGKVQGINMPFILLGQVENEGQDDGFLTLNEILNLNLDADMVVLSSCLTGRGEAMDGEGVLNFARAFHYAGSRTVLVSLWEVASEPTAEFMILFYRYQKEGKSKGEALSLARRQIKQKYPNPFFWAAFIMHGESI